MFNLITAVLLILFAALSRLLPHPMNFAPITAIALFGGAYLDRRLAFIVPLLAMLISDAFIGFYSGFYWVYGAFIVIGFIGLWLRNKMDEPAGKKILFIGSSALVSSVIFFLITNFAFLYPPTMYPHTFDGIIASYAAGIPFFRNTLAGDLIYTAMMFGVYELVTKYFGSHNIIEKKIKA